MAPGPRQIWRAIRPGNVIMTMFAVLIGAALASGNPLPDRISVYFSTVSAGLLLGFSNVFNDIRDVTIDERKGRPPGYATLSSGDMRSLCVVLISISGLLMITGMVLDRMVLPSMIFIGTIPAIMVYESSFKEKGLIGNITVGALIGSSFLFGGSHFDIFDPVVITLSSMAFLANVSREIVKDIEDMECDMSHRRTLPLTHGTRSACIYALVSAVLTVLLSTYPIFFLEPGPIFIGLIILADIALLASVSFLGSDMTDASVAQRTMKYSMVLVMIAFISTISGV